MDRAITVYPGAAPTHQCRYGEPLPDLPTNFLLGAPTASGKTQIILNIVLKCYLGRFARICFFCPSSKLDPHYKPLRDYLEKMTNQTTEALMFEDGPCPSWQDLGRATGDSGGVPETAGEAPTGS